MAGMTIYVLTYNGNTFYYDALEDAQAHGVAAQTAYVVKAMTHGRRIKGAVRGQGRQAFFDHAESVVAGFPQFKIATARLMRLGGDD